VTGLGPNSGNATGATSPSHTASIDYFFDTASPVDPEDPTLPWNISDIQVTPSETSALVTWTTDLPTDSSVAHGLTTGYELGSVSDPANVNSHIITLPGLDPNTTYHYQVTSVDPSSNAISSSDMTFTTTGVDISGIVSDDFSAATLNTSLWTLVDPKNDVVFSLTGYNTEDAWANLSVPAGVEHQVHLTGIQAPHLLQSANDTNFEVEVKFETSISPAFQEQGVVIKQDDDNFMRFEFYSTGTSTVLYAVGYTPSTSPTYVSTTIGTDGLAPLYMRIGRTGDLWTLSHSFDGSVWVSQTPFTHSLTVTGLGPYSGNATGATSPSHTASIDYCISNSVWVFRIR
jgi:regulation of enolase protein 1 (concanavalin A-like superfamily)